MFLPKPILPESRDICIAWSRPVRCGFSRTVTQRPARECQPTQLDHSNLPN